MRLGSDTGDHVEIVRAETGLDAHDVPLNVRVRIGEFTAAIETWVQRTDWLGFVQELVVLEERRQGEAKLVSMSPRELEVKNGALALSLTTRAD